MTIDFDEQAKLWHTDEPRHYGDFAGRPEAIDLVRKIGVNKRIIDLGCGEGYISRKIVDIAGKLVGVDKSEEMIALAKEKEQEEGRSIEYVVSDVTKMPFEEGEFDICFGSYITNNIHPERLPSFYKEMSRVMNIDGIFILLMPHPVLRLTTDFGEALVTDTKGYDYVASSGRFFDALAKTIQGTELKVGYYHQTFEDHFNSIESAGLRVNEVSPVIFPEEIAEKYPVFEKLGGKVVNLIMKGSK